MIDSCEGHSNDYNSSFLDFTIPYNTEDERYEQCQAFYYNGETWLIIAYCSKWEIDTPRIFFIFYFYKKLLYW